MRHCFGGFKLMGFFSRRSKSQASPCGRRQHHGGHHKYSKLGSFDSASTIEGDKGGASSPEQPVQCFYSENEVSDALAMAQVAMASLRRRAEQSEGEAALLEVQMLSHVEEIHKERKTRKKLEEDLGEKEEEVRGLQSAVADAVVAGRKKKNEIQLQLQETKKTLTKATEQLKEKDSEIKELRKECKHLRKQLEEKREQLAQDVEEHKRKNNVKSNPTGLGMGMSSDDHDVSNAAMTLARALAREMSGFEGEGLETEATATASAALNLAAALGFNNTTNRSAQGSGLQLLAPVTPPSSNSQQDRDLGQENVHPASKDAKGLYSDNKKGTASYSSSRNKAAVSSMSKLNSSHRDARKRLPLSSSKKTNQMVYSNSNSTTSSPWPNPLSATLGQFLTWSSRKRASSGHEQELVDGDGIFTPKSNVDASLTQSNIEYSVQSWE